MSDKEIVKIKWICPNPMCAEYWADSELKLDSLLTPEDIKVCEEYKDKITLKVDSMIECPKCHYVYEQRDIHKLILDNLYKVKRGDENK
jgi:hypothetical protein